MSKLYDAIDRLEQIAEGQGTEEKEVPPSMPSEPHRRSFFLRPLLFAALVIVIGCGMLVGVAWWKDWFVRVHPSSPAGVTSSEALSQFPASSATEQGAVGAVDDVGPEKRAVSATAPDMVPEDEEVSNSGINVAVSPEEGRLVAAPLDREANNSTEKFGARFPAVEQVAVESVPVRGNQSSVVEPQPLSSGLRIDTARAQQRRKIGLTRLLLQAEQRRRDHDWQGAVLLYRQVWEESGNPAVANNLAAALLKLHKKEQAIRVLEAALAISPDDDDLQVNLNLARQGKR